MLHPCDFYFHHWTAVDLLPALARDLFSRVTPGISAVIKMRFARRCVLLEDAFC
jgi:hypothetical protein